MLIFFLPFPQIIVGNAATCIGEAFMKPQSVRPFNIFGLSSIILLNGV